MITPEVGKTYVVKHSSGFIEARFIRLNEYHAPSVVHSRIFGDLPSHRHSTTHYVFENLKTGREIIIKSRVKIRREFIAQSTI